MMTAQSLCFGEPAPYCYGVTVNGQVWSFMHQAGRPALVLAMGGFAPPELGALICVLSEISIAAAAFDADILLLCVCPPQAGRALAQALPPGLTLLMMEAKVFDQLGVVPGHPLLFLLDRNMRVAGLYGEACVASAAEIASAALIDLEHLPREKPRQISAPAPILLIPNLLDRDLCTELIASFENGLQFDSGIGGIDATGAACIKFDQATKRRRDVLIDPAHELYARVADAVLERSRPEIKKSFQIEINHLDRVLVGRYDLGDGYYGHFRRHRDNVLDNVAFREFALSINLNAGAFDGGRLSFPEFNSHEYEIPAGGGLVFSASLLHEALPVTRGSRYVLLTFLHSDTAEMRRLVYEATQKRRQPVSAFACPTTVEGVTIGQR